MIKEIHEKDIAECVNVIKESFLTVPNSGMEIWIFLC